MAKRKRTKNALIKEKIRYAKKFGMVNLVFKLNQEYDLNVLYEKVEKKGYKRVDVKSKEFLDRICPLVKKPTVVTEREETGRDWLGHPVIEERNVGSWEEKRDDLLNTPLEAWSDDIPLTVLQKVEQAKRDGFKAFQVFYPYSFCFGNCNDPVVVGYIHTNRSKNCRTYVYGGGFQPCTAPSDVCEKNHWNYNPLGDPFEIASWEKCDLEKE